MTVIGMSAAKRCIGRFISCQNAIVLSQIDKQHHTIVLVRANTTSAVSRGLIFTPKRTTTDKGKSGNDNKKWWRSSFEFKIVALVVTGLATHIMTQFFQRRQANRIVRLQHVNKQLEKLYGPLYGNRLVQEKVYLAVMGEFKGLKRYLKQAEDTKDAAMIHQWRSFLVKVLYPLDQEASALISQNGQLIVDNDFPQSFDHFLTHLAKLQFIMEVQLNGEQSLNCVAQEYTPRIESALLDLAVSSFEQSGAYPPAQTLTCLCQDGHMGVPQSFLLYHTSMGNGAFFRKCGVTKQTVDYISNGCTIFRLLKGAEPAKD